MSRQKTSKYEPDPPKPQPFMTPEKKKIYLMIAGVDAALFLGIVLVAVYKFVPVYPTAPALAFAMVIFNYGVLIVKRKVLMHRGGK